MSRKPVTTVNKEPIDKRVEREHQLSELRGMTVAIHNSLIQNDRYTRNAGNSLSLTEQKIILYIISKIKPTDRHLEPISFSISEFCEVCGIGHSRSGGVYSFMKSNVEKLASRVMWLDNGETETMVRWISKARISKGRGIMEVELDEDMMPYLLNLRGNYTSFFFAEVSRFKCKYSFRLYELLLSYLPYGNRIITFELKDLRERLDCTSKSYDNYTNFERRVLAPAMKDLEQYTSMKVSYNVVRKGKSITYIEFDAYNLRRSDNISDQELAEERYMAIETEILRAKIDYRMRAEERRSVFDEIIDNSDWADIPAPVIIEDDDNDIDPDQFSLFEDDKTPVPF